jgi:hypothetical protein
LFPFQESTFYREQDVFPKPVNTGRKIEFSGEQMVGTILQKINHGKAFRRLFPRWMTVSWPSGDSGNNAEGESWR